MGNDIREMKLQAKDLVCSACAADMEGILKEKKGIVDASVDYSTEIIIIKYDISEIDRKEAYLSVRKLSNISKIISET